MDFAILVSILHGPKYRFATRPVDFIGFGTDPDRFIRQNSRNFGFPFKALVDRGPKRSGAENQFLFFRKVCI